MFTSMRSRRMPAFKTTASSLPNAEIAWSTMRLAPFQSETSSPLATASPPLALISLTTCWAGPTSWPLPARSPPRSFTTTLAPCSASIRQCSRPTPRAPPVTIATRPSHNLAIAPSRLLRVWNGPCCASLAANRRIAMDTLPLVSPEQVGLSAARLARISEWMKGWVDSGKLPGLLVAVMRRGELAFAETYGKADVERNKPLRPDTIYRFYSMTKPLTAVTILTLYEQGHFQLDDPISRYIPAFANNRVFAGISFGKISSTPAERDITFRDLLTHTSGLTYGFMEANPVDALYRAKDGIGDFGGIQTSLKELVEKLATYPLIAQPGKAWNYSVSIDVLGYLVEVISGQPFDV